MLSISLNSRTASTIVFDLAGRTTGTYDTVDVQYSCRPDFNFTLAPVVNFATAAQITLQGLNQANLYFVRARERASGTGAAGPWALLPAAAYTLQSTTLDTAPLAIMLRPAIIVVPEPVTWSYSGGGAAGYPADNLSSDSPAEQAWFAPGYLYFDTGGQPIDTIALLGTNIPPGVDWQVEAFGTAANRAAGTSILYASAGTQFHASPNLPGRQFYNGLIRLPAPRNELYWRVVFSAFSGTLPPGNIIAAMFGVVGLARTAKNIAADKVESPLDYGNLERTRDGVPDRRFGWRGRRVDFEIAFMTEAQWETQFSDLRRKVGLTEPALVVPNTRTGSFLHDRILYGPLTAQRAQQPYTPRFTQGFTVDSLI
jgi:hypothetical protein